MPNQKLSQVPELIEPIAADWLLGSSANEPGVFKKISYDHVIPPAGLSGAFIYVDGAISPHQIEAGDRILANINNTGKSVDFPASPAIGATFQVINVGTKSLSLGSAPVLFKGQNTALKLRPNNKGISLFVYKNHIDGWIAFPEDNLYSEEPDLLFDKVNLLLLFSGNDGDTTTTDSSNYNSTVTLGSPAQLTDSDYKFPPTSFNANGGNLKVTYQNRIGFTMPGTIECWVKTFTSGFHRVLSQAGPSGTGHPGSLLVCTGTATDFFARYWMRSSSDVWNYIDSPYVPHTEGDWVYFKLVLSDGMGQFRANDHIGDKQYLPMLFVQGAYDIYMSSPEALGQSPTNTLVDSLRFTSVARDISHKPTMPFAAS